jgi:hypothetical protein
MLRFAKNLSFSHLYKSFYKSFIALKIKTLVRTIIVKTLNIYLYIKFISILFSYSYDIF